MSMERKIWVWHKLNYFGRVVRRPPSLVRLFEYYLCKNIRDIFGLRKVLCAPVSRNAYHIVKMIMEVRKELYL